MGNIIYYKKLFVIQRVHRIQVVWMIFWGIKIRADRKVLRRTLQNSAKTHRKWIAKV